MQIFQISLHIFLFSPHNMQGKPFPRKRAQPRHCPQRTDTPPPERAVEQSTAQQSPQSPAAAQRSAGYGGEISCNLPQFPPPRPETDRPRKKQNSAQPGKKAPLTKLRERSCKSVNGAGYFHKPNNKGIDLK